MIDGGAMHVIGERETVAEAMGSAHLFAIKRARNAV
jgi:hypothetical protein